MLKRYNRAEVMASVMEYRYVMIGLNQLILDASNDRGLLLKYAKRFSHRIIVGDLDTGNAVVFTGSHPNRVMSYDKLGDLVGG